MIKTIKEGRSIIMSSQHLEEADELSDRICIMTKGQLLSLDSPQEIKRKFGVGYKILIEPKESIEADEFLQMKQEEIDPFLLSQENLESLQISENMESTNKKLIYQIPFSHLPELGGVLKELESKFSNRAYVDVEVNTLEDAYINIAKEEVNLLAKLKRERNYQDQEYAEIELLDLEKQEARSTNQVHSEDNLH